MSGELSLTGFLLTRIAEDEEAARLAASRNNGAEWETDTRSSKVLSRWSPGMVGVMATCEPGGGKWVVVHIARHDPARVLAECEARNQIVRLYERAPQPNLYLVLSLLALPYAEHPDYNREWLP